MTMTRAEAEQVVEEARQQGWEADKHLVNEGTDDEYNEGRGRVEMLDWDQINRQRVEIGNEPVGGHGCTVELVWPTWENPKYLICDTDEWRRLKAKVDELKQIMKEMVERGWDHDNNIVKSGEFGMMIKAVYPPGYRRPYGVQVGGMRTWRKVCREADSIIDQTDRPAIEPAR